MKFNDQFLIYNETLVTIYDINSFLFYSKWLHINLLAHYIVFRFVRE
jgi:hypothetical protein